MDNESLLSLYKLLLATLGATLYINLVEEYINSKEKIEDYTKNLEKVEKNIKSLTRRHKSNC